MKFITWKEIRFTTAAGIIFLIILESAASLFIPDESYREQIFELHPFLFCRMKPNIEVQFGDKSKLNTNSLGLQNEDVPFEKPDNYKRVLLLGGSAAMGVGVVEEDSTIARVIERTLQNHYPDHPIQVINGAAMGYNSAQELIIYEFIASDYHPDVVVCLDGWNDAFSTITTGVPGYPEFYAQYLSKKHDFNSRWDVVKHFFKRSAIYRLYKRASLPGRNKPVSLPDEINTPSVHREIARQYARNMQNLKYLTTANSAAFMIFIQPYLGTTQKSLSENEQRLLESWNWQIPGIDDYIRENLRLMSEDLHNLSDLDQQFIYDLNNEFMETDQTIFDDQCHLVDLGQRLTGEFIAGKIIEADFLSN